MLGDPIRFETLKGRAALEALAQLPGNCFQRAEWVSAVSVVRRRAHQFVAIRSVLSQQPPAFLFGALHLRGGLGVFESMPMGGYGGWVSERALDLGEERDLTSKWLSQAPWWIVQLISGPGRNSALPDAPAWPLPNSLRRRFEAHDLETHVLDLRGDDATLLSRVRPGIRSYLRRVEQLGFAFKMGHRDQLQDFCDWYRIGSLGWQKQATGILSDEFFSSLCREGYMDVWVVSQNGRPVGAAAFLLGPHQVQYQASGSAKLPGPVSAIDALIWTAAKHYRERGFHSMNMGASEGLEGVRRFKEKFGAVPVNYRRAVYVLPRMTGMLESICRSLPIPWKSKSLLKSARDMGRLNIALAEELAAEPRGCQTARMRTNIRANAIDPDANQSACVIGEIKNPHALITTMLEFKTSFVSINERALAWLKRPLRYKVASLNDRMRHLFFDLDCKIRGLDFQGNISNKELIADSEFSLSNATAYQPTSSRRLKQLLSESFSSGIDFENFLDVGCGKGFPCIVAAKTFKFRKIYGFDFSDSLVDIAKKNQSRSGFGDIKFIKADATEFEIPNGNTVVYLFNPFNGIILKKFIELNMEHFLNNNSVIAYAYDDHRSVLIDLGFEVIFRSQNLKNSVLRYRRFKLTQERSQ